MTAAALALECWLTFGTPHGWADTMALLRGALRLVGVAAIGGGARLIFWEPGGAGTGEAVAERTRPWGRCRADDEGPGSRNRGLRSKGVAGAGVEPATYRFSGDRSYQLSYPAAAVLTGFEPAASTLTGWRALQTAPQDLALCESGLNHSHTR